MIKKDNLIKSMEVIDLKEKLNSLLALDAEMEVVEFKEAKNQYDFTKLGRYFSALSNEANLKNRAAAWLVFGVEDKNHEVVGTQYRPKRKDLDHLKGEIANKITNRITFIEIHEVNHPEGRVVLFEIPPAPKGMPIAFDGHYYGRDGEALAPLNMEEIERIRFQVTKVDWSAGVVSDATISDLDEDAIHQARKNYKGKFPEKAIEVDEWDDITFLNKAKVTIKNKITRTAILLLGKEESEHFITPAEAKIRWLLKDANGNDKDYAIIGLPLLLAVDKVYLKIRNLKYRYMQEGTLFPEEVNQYEPYSIREAMNNCIAHQDYTKQGRINVVEMDDQLIFTNLGKFIPESVEKAVMDNAPEEQYRNPFLATAMFNLKMVDTVGGGIRKMFLHQIKRFFPMPDYDLRDEKVRVTLTGKILDMAYARALAQNTKLTLQEIILLDKVQKKQPITPEGVQLLKSKKLIEGRKPNFFIGIDVAQKTGQKAEYTTNKAFDKQYYFDLILRAIRQHEFVTRSDIDKLLWKKLPDWMDEHQKKNKINNIISELKKKKVIKNTGAFKLSQWRLSIEEEV